MNYGRVEEQSSSRSRSPSTARRAATSAILTDILSRSDRAPILRTVDTRAGWDADFNAFGCPLRKPIGVSTTTPGSRTHRWGTDRRRWVHLSWIRYSPRSQERDLERPYFLRIRDRLATSYVMIAARRRLVRVSKGSFVPSSLKI